MCKLIHTCNCIWEREIYFSDHLLIVTESARSHEKIFLGSRASCRMWCNNFSPSHHSYHSSEKFHCIPEFPLNGNNNVHEIICQLLSFTSVPGFAVCARSSRGTDKPISWLHYLFITQFFPGCHLCYSEFCYIVFILFLSIIGCSESYNLDGWPYTFNQSIQ